MRAHCETCSKPQPADWQPGNLCIHCGQAVRQEDRCYWCAHWIPSGKFCRSCGAEGIPGEQYAPARMMKFYGADMFSIPKMLREMDPDRVDTFRAIYNQHLAVATRHVEEVRQLEPVLFHKHWSSLLEEELVPQLPWDEKAMAMYSAQAKSGSDSPFPMTRSLANLVALRSGKYSLLSTCGYDLGSADPELRLETALQLANWRVAGFTYLESLRYTVRDVLREFAKDPNHPLATYIRMSQYYLGEEGIASPDDEVTSSNDEVSFYAAVMTDEGKAVLQRSLHSSDEMRRQLSARRLLRMHCTDGIADVYASSTPEQKERLLQEIQLAKKPVRALHDVLFQTVQEFTTSKLGRAAAHAICLDCTHAEAMRLAETKNWDILHVVALAKLAPETYRAVGEMLVREGMVNFNKFAWTNLASGGKMPLDFVRSVFHTVDPEAQRHLLRFVEKQVEELPGLPRHTPAEEVLVRTAFGDHDPEVIGEAWCGLHRLNYRREYASPSPFPYTSENIERYWPMHEFERRVAALQANGPAMKQTFVEEDLRRFLRSKDRD
jgi:hypothetical protein